MGIFRRRGWWRCSPLFLCFWVFILIIDHSGKAYGDSLYYPKNYSDAAAVVAELKKQPEVVFFQLAAFSLGKGRWQKTFAAARQTLDINPGNRRARAFLGAAAGLAGDLMPTRQAFERLQKSSYQDELVSLMEAILLVQEGDPEKARETLDTGLKQQSADPVLRYYSGLLFLEAGDTEMAEMEFKRALEVQPGFTPALAGMGQAALARSDYKAAVRFYQRAITQDPEHQAYHQSLIEIYGQMGDTAQAQKAMLRMQVYTQAAKETRLKKGRQLFAKGAYRETIEEMDKALSVYVEIPEAHYLRAGALTNLGEFEAARQNLAIYLLQCWDVDRAHHLAGICFLAMGDFAMAEDEFKLAVSHSLIINEAFLALTVIDQMRGDYERAQIGLLLALSSGQSPPLIHYLMAQTFLADGDAKAYGRHMSLAAELIPGLSADTLFTLPERNQWRSVARDRSLLFLYFNNAWYDKALEASRRVLKTLSEDVVAAHYKALVEDIRKRPL